MRPKRVAVTLAVVALIAGIIGANAAQIYHQQNFRYIYTEYPHHVEVSSIAGLNAVSINPYTLLGVTPALSVQTSPATQTYLNNTTRSEIFSYISQNPGVQFRAIAAALCLPLGLAEYHIGVLVRTGLVSFIRDGRYKRFFIAKRYSKGEMQTISLLRHRTTRRIIEVLLHKKELSHCRLADEVAISSQALTWQMKTLRETRYVVEVCDGVRTFYSLDGATSPALVKFLSAVE